MQFGELGRLLAPTGRASAVVERFLRCAPPLRGSYAKDRPVATLSERTEYWPCAQCGKRVAIVGFAETPLPHRCRR